MRGPRVPVVFKLWGREIILTNEHGYCCKLLQYDGIRTSSLHYHERKHETFVVAKGRFEVEWFEPGNQDHRTISKLEPGHALVLAPGTAHRVKCVSPEGGTIAEASTYDDPNDCVRLEPSVNPFGAS